MRAAARPADRAVWDELSPSFSNYLLYCRVCLPVADLACLLGISTLDGPLVQWEERMEAGSESGTEHRSARRSCSAARPSRSAASANSAASRLVASCCCSAESGCMRGAARRTRSRGTRSCIAFLPPVEDQTHTKVWSEGRAVQPPHAGRPSRLSPNEGRFEPVQLHAGADFSAGSRDLSATCQPCVSDNTAASGAQSWGSGFGQRHTPPSSTAIAHTAQLPGVEQVVAGVAAVIDIWAPAIGLVPLAK